MEYSGTPDYECTLSKTNHVELYQATYHQEMKKYIQKPKLKILKYKVLEADYSVKRCQNIWIYQVLQLEKQICCSLVSVYMK